MAAEQPLISRAKHRFTALSPLGWAALSAAVVLGAGGLWLGWVEFVALAVFMAILVLVGLSFTVGRSSYRVELKLAQDRIRVGSRAFGQIDVANVGSRALLPARIELPVGRGRAEFFLPRLGAGAVHEEIFTIPTTNRAVIPVGPISSVRSDPLGMARRELVWTDVQELFVHPRTVSLGAHTAGVMRDLEGQTLKTVTDNDMSFHALREYVAGDDRRNIHWKSSARTQSLMVRQFEDTRRTITALALIDDPLAWASEQEYELAISVLASLGIAAIREGLELSVFSGAQPLRAAVPRMLLDDCSRLALAADPGDLVSPVQVVTRSAPDSSLAIFLTGSLASKTVLAQITTGLPNTMRAVLIALDPAGPLHVSRQGQTSFARLGDLEDLPKLMRRVVVL